MSRSRIVCGTLASCSLERIVSSWRAWMGSWIRFKTTRVDVLVSMARRMVEQTVEKLDFMEVDIELLAELVDGASFDDIAGGAVLSSSIT